MPTTYTTRDGDVLDRICHAHYGREDAIVAVYEANPGLAKKGIFLPARVVIVLPDLPPRASPGIDLWDGQGAKR